MSFAGGGSRSRKAARKAAFPEEKRWSLARRAKSKRGNTTWSEMARKHISDVYKFGACDSKRQALTKAEADVESITSAKLHRAAKKALKKAQNYYKLSCK